MKEGDCTYCRIGDGLTRAGIAQYGFFCWVCCIQGVRWLEMDRLWVHGHGVWAENACKEPRRCCILARLDITASIIFQSVIALIPNFAFLILQTTRYILAFLAKLGFRSLLLIDFNDRVVDI